MVFATYGQQRSNTPFSSAAGVCPEWTLLLAWTWTGAECRPASCESVGMTMRPSPTYAHIFVYICPTGCLLLESGLSPFVWSKRTFHVQTWRRP
jgi:hypothetical protein